MNVHTAEDGCFMVMLRPEEAATLCTALSVVSDRSDDQAVERLYRALTERGVEVRDVEFAPNVAYDPEDESYGPELDVVVQ